MASDSPLSTDPTPLGSQPAVYRGELDETAVGSQVTMLHIGELLLRYRRIVFGVPLVLFLLTAVFGLISTRTYTAVATFMPQSASSSLAGFSGLAAQFGVNVPGRDLEQSPEFYTDLLVSRQLLRDVVDTEFRFSTNGDSLRGTLMDFYDVSKPTPALRREVTVNRLLGDISVSAKVQTRVVRLTVRTEYAELSRMVVSYMLESVNRFNLNSRQTQASQERKFIETRRSTAREELREAEDALQRFLQENRQYRSSPQLTFEHDRLQREVGMRQQVYTSIAQSYEQARIDEVRNTPVITVVEEPVVPAKPDSRLLVLKGLLALMGGTILGGLAALGLESFKRSRETHPEVTEELRALSKETIQDIRRPWRLLRFPFGKRS